MGLTWDEAKNRANRQKHGINFLDAVGVFDDDYRQVTVDPYPHEERFRTYGMVNNVLIVVVHTEIEENQATGEPFGRIISARMLSNHERRRFEEGTL